MPKNSFVVYHNYRETLEDLTDEQVGILFRAILDYEIDKKEPNFSGELKIAFRFIKKDLDLNSDKYESICERNRANGSKGGRPKNPKNPNGLSKTQRNPEKPKKPDNDNVVDNDNEDDNDNGVVDVDIQNSTTTKLKTLQSLCDNLTIDVTPTKEYNLDLLIEKVKSSRFLKKFNLLSEMLKKYDLIVTDRYKDYYEDKKPKSKNFISREYTPEQMEALKKSVFMDIEDIEI